MSGDGGPAFPVMIGMERKRNADGDLLEGYETQTVGGATLRDYFAATALAGYFAAPNTQHRNASDCAAYMYEMADAMLVERAKGPK